MLGNIYGVYVLYIYLYTYLLYYIFIYLTVFFLTLCGVARLFIGDGAIEQSDPALWLRLDREVVVGDGGRQIRFPRPAHAPIHQSGHTLRIVFIKDNSIVPHSLE